MNFTNILQAFLFIGVIGGVLGFLLAVASKIFEVKVDERIEEISEVLPGANCGGCGFVGCSEYAAAVVNDGCATNCCVAGGNAVAQAVANIMGVESESISPESRKVALVRCSGGVNAERKYEYTGISDCISASLVAGGPLGCSFGCLGYGSCVAACPFDAIHLNANGVAEVDDEKCTGCMTCVNTCPRHIIVEVPYHSDITVKCSSQERGAVLRYFCNIGCLGCHICERTCQHDAIHVVDNLASIDQSKCVSCGECVQKCPRHLIHDSRLKDRAQPSVAVKSA